MSNPTSNFGWQMPTATDLVTDLPADFEVFGQAVDTSLADLKGGTTGQILSKTTNADMDFTWIANDQGDITEITATSPLTGGGTSGAITVGIQDGTTTQKGAVQLENSTSSTSTTKAAVSAAVKSAYDLANAAIPNSLVDAKADLITATADNTPARLAVGANETRLVADSVQATGLKYVADTTNYAINAKGDLLAGTAADTLTALSVGTNGQTLVADSSTATGLAWSTPSAGGMTLISTTTLSGSSISLTSIPGTYKNLVVVVRNYKPATNGEYLIGQFNTDTGTTYRDVTASADAVGAPDRANLTVSFEASNSVSNSIQNWTIYDYANTTTYKQAETISWNTNKTTTANMNFIRRNHLWYNTAAITSIQLKPSAGNFTSGTALLYGVS